MPLPVPFWPRTLPPEKPGGAFPSRGSTKLSCLPGAGPGSHWDRASPHLLGIGSGSCGGALEVSSLALGMGRSCSSMAVAHDFRSSQCLPVRQRSQGAQEERKEMRPEDLHFSISLVPLSPPF